MTNIYYKTYNIYCQDHRRWWNVFKRYQF